MEDEEIDLLSLFGGAGIQVAAKSASHLAFIYAKHVAGVSDEELRKFPWYAFPFGENLPPVDDWVLDLLLPAGLLGAGFVTEDEKLRDAGIGAGLTGLATMLHTLISLTPRWIPPPEAGSPSQSSTPRRLVGKVVKL